MTASSQTTCMVLTPPGAGAIAVIRVAGIDAATILQSRLRRTGGRSVSELREGQLFHGELVEGDEVIDDVIASVSSQADRPFIDLCTHGGVRVVERALAALERAGAVFCDHSDEQAWSAASIIESEALRALQSAKTGRAVDFAAYQRMYLEPHLKVIATLCRVDPQEAARQLDLLTADYPAARLLLEGAKVVLVGPPNSGKSTLLNRLIGRSAAVVSPKAGTTRDFVSVELDFAGAPVTLYDTPGRHEPADGLEREALAAAASLWKSADLAVVVLDGADKLPSHNEWFAHNRDEPPRQIWVANKSDQARSWSADELIAEIGTCDARVVQLSALSGSGIDEFVNTVTQSLALRDLTLSTAAFFTSRQVETAGAIKSRILDGQAETAPQEICSKLIGYFRDSGCWTGL